MQACHIVIHSEHQPLIFPPSCSLSSEEEEPSGIIPLALKMSAAATLKYFQILQSRTDDTDARELWELTFPRTGFQFSGLYRELPRSVHLMTLEALSSTRALVRLEHLYSGVDSREENDVRVSVTVSQGPSALIPSSLVRNRDGWRGAVPSPL